MKTNPPARFVAEVHRRNLVSKAARQITTTICPFIKKHTGTKVLSGGIITDAFINSIPQLKDEKGIEYTFNYNPAGFRGDTSGLTWGAVITVPFTNEDGTEDKVTHFLASTLGALKGGRLFVCDDRPFGNFTVLHKPLNPKTVWAMVKKRKEFAIKEHRIAEQLNIFGIDTYKWDRCTC